ncbi:NAD(P)-binding protein [Psychrobacter sp. NPDC078370]|uniref:NAD(P)-binding protein n=1 Tax=unclassified Psychrobacter TaxID=196806 RepID=UPI0018D537A7|nr:FAD/NAD(P)-binding protein [Psychrobacter sp. MES7-P7E]
MSIQQIETDYLIIGSGAVGMAFADVLLTETDANIIIVDKHHKPGGHWNDAYSFVTLQRLRSIRKSLMVLILKLQYQQPIPQTLRLLKVLSLAH